MLKFSTVKSISDSDLDNLITETYGRPHCFQQQAECRDRGMYYITVPDPYALDFTNSTIPEKVNGEERGVSFAAWLARDPNQPLDTEDEWDRKHGLDLFWTRNFYPSIEIVANDLYSRGLMEAGKYHIVIDW
jgi:hypothetical protein